MAEQGGVHDDHPFETPSDQRDPARRFRGRMAAPVTIVTSGHGDHRTGLTVSSLVVAEGDPSRVYFLLGSTTDLFYGVEETGKFVVHVLEQGDQALADVFAGLRPSPGGRFTDLNVEQTEWGPVLTDLKTRAYCTFEGGDEETFFIVAEGRVDKLELSDIDKPLVYFRGRYRTLG
ncbi:MAG: flavin reductase family protein [Acidimicrobiia bacterium]|nr:flavin reductase family protein [Acidimicrobiia bacterium]MDX2466398.1 flavin reductase family protein [Acidimicrobiia bacterium]